MPAAAAAAPVCPPAKLRSADEKLIVHWTPAVSAPPPSETLSETVVPGAPEPLDRLNDAGKAGCETARESTRRDHRIRGDICSLRDW